MKPQEEPSEEGWRKKYGGWLVIGGLLVIFVIAVILFPNSARGKEGLEACPAAGPSSSPSPPPTSNPSAAPSKIVLPAALAPEQPEVVIDFWRDRTAHAAYFYLDAAKKKRQKGQKIAPLRSGSYFDVSKRPLYRQELDGSIAPDQYVAIAQVTGPKEVRVIICANPQARDLDPGTYSGFVRIRDPSIEDVTVPVTVALQSPEVRPVLALFGIIVFLAGSFSVWASGRRPDNKQIWAWKDGLDGLPRWLLYNYVGVVAGAIAAISVFLAKYWHNPAWGAKAPDDWFALLGSTFTAYTATLAAASAVVRKKPGGQPTAESREEQEAAK